MMKASEIMTGEVISVHPDTPIGQIARVLLDKGISAVPVIDETGAPEVHQELSKNDGSHLLCPSNKQTLPTPALPPRVLHEALLSDIFERIRIHRIISETNLARYRMGRQRSHHILGAAGPGAQVCTQQNETFRSILKQFFARNCMILHWWV